MVRQVLPLVLRLRKGQTGCRLVRDECCGFRDDYEGSGMHELRSGGVGDCSGVSGLCLGVTEV